MPDSQFTIGQIAQATGLKAVTLRYYERLGLLPAAARSSSGYRLYAQEDLDRLLFLRRLRALGFSLDDSRELLALARDPQASCASVDAKVQAHLAEVRARLEDLRQLERELEGLASCCRGGGAIDQCRIIDSLSEPR